MKELLAIENWLEYIWGTYKTTKLNIRANWSKSLLVELEGVLRHAIMTGLNTMLNLPELLSTVYRIRLEAFPCR